MMRRRRSISIRADDHLSDPLGALFLLEPEQISDTVIDKLCAYLGPKTRVLKATLSRDRLEVEVECLELNDESNRMVEAAAGLRTKRLYRSAISMLRDALALDPLNPRALFAMGEALQGSERYAEAAAMMVRAREAAGSDSADLLAALGACCLKLERTAAAIAYFEAALALDPRHFSARRAFAALGRKPPALRARPPADDSPLKKPNSKR
jgi:tetratricopeptide (TPR) repeat protein